MKTTIALLALTIAMAVGAGTAMAGEGSAVVPPGNSAATQYTEAFPTSGGDKKTDQARHRSPSKVLGAKNAHRLDSRGPDGAAAAAVAAATAPSPPEPESSAAVTAPRPQGHHPSGTGGSSGGGKRGDARSPEPSPAPQQNTASSRPVAQPQGSSGLGSAIGVATGFSSSGGSGWFLPLILLATALWAGAYIWQQRRQVG
jgi:hypothetical protein